LNLLCHTENIENDDGLIESPMISQKILPTDPDETLSESGDRSFFLNRVGSTQE